MESEKQIGDFFSEHGYYHARGVFGADEIRTLELEFDRIVGQLHGSGEDIDATWQGAEMERLKQADDRVIHTHNVQCYSAAWLQAMLHPTFLHVAQAILGENIVLHHSKLFQKPPKAGAPFPIHQDWSYFPSEKNTMIAAVIHVSPATDHMGCLRLYPGSHRLGPLPDSSGQSPCDALGPYPLEHATPVAANPGDVLFFHYFTLHGSQPNRSEQSRKTVLVQLHSGDDMIDPNNQHPNARLVLRGFNKHMSRNRANAS